MNAEFVFKVAGNDRVDCNFFFKLGKVADVVNSNSKYQEKSTD